jgi:hypothetical protein
MVRSLKGLPLRLGSLRSTRANRSRCWARSAAPSALGTARRRLAGMLEIGSGTSRSKGAAPETVCLPS